MRGLSAAEAGLAIKPDDPPLYRARGNAEHPGPLRTSDIRRGIHAIAVKSTRPEKLVLWLVALGDAELGLGHVDAAVEEYHKAINVGWRAYQPYRSLAAAYALEGKMEEAASALAEEPAASNPQLSLSNGSKPDSMNVPPLLEGLRKAGLPEE